MNKNKTYLLGGLLVVLVVVAYFLTADTGTKTETESIPAKEKEFFTLDSANVDRLEIVTSKGKIVLVKTAGTWRQTEPVDYPVTSTFVPPAVGDLKNFKLSSIVSVNPAKFESYGFHDTNKVTVTVFEKGAPKGTIVIGNAGIGASQSYVKRADKNAVYLADNLLRLNFVKEDIDGFRDKQIVAVPTAMLKTIDFSYPDESFTITKDSLNRFTIGSDSIQYSNMEGYLNLLANMNTQGFAAMGSLDSVKKFTAVIKITADKVYELDLLKVDGAAPYYLMRVAGKPAVFRFDENLAKSFMKTKNSFLGK